MKFSAFPKIGQFRNTIKSVKEGYTYTLDLSTDQWVHDPTKTPPVLVFTGTTKIHGTNAGIYCSQKIDGLEVNAQTRNAAVDGSGHFGFVEWLSVKGQDLASKVLDLFGEEIAQKDFVIYGEWCGGGIQKGVAVNGLPKMFVIFGVKIISDKYGDDEDEANYWVDEIGFEQLASPEDNIYGAGTFGRFVVEIDFANPQLNTNMMCALTEQVEKVCPVGAYFGRVVGEDNTTGEGIVWSHRKTDGSILRFKVKGEKHQSSKVKTLASVDTERLNSITEFVEYAVTEARLEQAAIETLTAPDFDRKNLGKFIKWVSSDIAKEESDVLVDNDLSMKDVGSALSAKARAYFFAQESV